MSAPKPFVKWAGGKKQLLPVILPQIPSNISRYFEPFIGGGAVYWNIKAKEYHINDYNSELTNVYACVKASLKGLCADLQILQNAFYALADENARRDFYNSIRDTDRSANFKTTSPTARAARFIFLNKTCFNGLFRQNTQGFMNTPYGQVGKYNKALPLICDVSNLNACSNHMTTTTIHTGSFIQLKKLARPDDFWFFDPPYLPLKKGSDFTAYTDAGFPMSEHEALADLLRYLDSIGAKFMLTNHNTPVAHDLYKGFHITPVNARRAISSSASTRTSTENIEIIVKNY